MNAFKCKKCKEIKVSRYRHDFQQCACGNFVDGGDAYNRAGGNFEDMEFLYDLTEEEVADERRRA